MNVELVGLGDDGGAWDRFVDAMPSATIFHRRAWRRALAAEFGFTACDLLVRRHGEIAGVLPLCEVRVPFGRPVLLSQPFCVEAGVCARDDESAQALAAAAVELGRDRGVEYVELRDQHRDAGFVRMPATHGVFRGEIPDDRDRHWRAMSAVRRNMVRRARRDGLSLRTGTEQLDSFYDVYARSLRRLATPVFPRTWLRRLVDELGDRSLLSVVWRDDLPVAGVLSFVFRDTILPYYAGSRRDAPSRGANDLMYWELMDLARARGLVRFDFGRSRIDSGAWDFKRHWGFTPQLLTYRRCAAAGALPTGSTDATTAMALARRLWPRLPLSLTKWLGPPLIRRIGALHT